MQVRRWTIAAVAAAVAAASAAALNWRAQRDDRLLGQRLASIQAIESAQRVDCAGFRSQRPLVLLALGQSNAGNHGELGSPTDVSRIQLVQGDACALARDPLPGATGQGGSVWSLLPEALERGGWLQPVVLQVLAVDATSIDDWVRPGSPLRQHLLDTLAASQQVGMGPDLILWQQGEADAMRGTSPSRFAQALGTLVQILSVAGVQAPLLAAQSTVCRSSPAADLRLALHQVAQGSTRIAIGPDTDALVGPGYRIDGCHWTTAGRRTVANLWAQAITAKMATKTATTAP